MKKMAPNEFADKWGRNLKSQVSDIVRGIDRVEVSPGQKAAAKKDKWAARMSDTETHRKWAERTGSITLEEWRDSARTLIPQRLPGGVDRAMSKVADFAAVLLPYQERGLAELERMPDLTLEDSRARMNKWFDHMSKLKYR